MKIWSANIIPTYCSFPWTLKQEPSCDQSHTQTDRYTPHVSWNRCVCLFCFRHIHLSVPGYAKKGQQTALLLGALLFVRPGVRGTKWETSLRTCANERGWRVQRRHSRQFGRRARASTSGLARGRNIFCSKTPCAQPPAPYTVRSQSGHSQVTVRSTVRSQSGHVKTMTNGDGAN